jgi:hypothetical protein
MKRDKNNSWKTTKHDRKNIKTKSRERERRTGEFQRVDKKLSTIQGRNIAWKTNPCRILLFISLRDFLFSFLFLFVFSLSLVSLSSQAIFEKKRWEHYRPHSRFCASSLENCGDELFSICSNDRSERLLAFSLFLFFYTTRKKRNIRNH